MTPPNHFGIIPWARWLIRATSLNQIRVRIILFTLGYYPARLLHNTMNYPRLKKAFSNIITLLMISTSSYQIPKTTPFEKKYLCLKKPILREKDFIMKIFNLASVDGSRMEARIIGVCLGNLLPTIQETYGLQTVLMIPPSDSLITSLAQSHQSLALQLI